MNTQELSMGRWSVLRFIASRWQNEKRIIVQVWRSKYSSTGGEKDLDLGFERLPGLVIIPRV